MPWNHGASNAASCIGVYLCGDLDGIAEVHSRMVWESGGEMKKIAVKKGESMFHLAVEDLVGIG
jgi:hypothetical protein